MNNIKVKNKSLNILIMSAGRATPLFFAFRKAFNGLHIKGKIIAIDIDPYAAALQFADTSYIVPRQNSIHFKSALKKIISKENISLVIPLSDDDVMYLAREKKELQSSGAILLIPDLAIAKLSFNKLEFLEFCRKHHFKTPKVYTSAYLKKGLKKLIFPLFINSNTGKGSRFAHKIEDAHDLKYFLKKINLPIVMEYIDAPEYSIDCFCDFDGNVISVVPRRRTFVWGGEAFVSVTEKNLKIIDTTVNLLRKLHMSGPVNIQCFFKNNEVIFFEMNPRLGGASRLAIEAGAETPKLILNLLQGKEARPRIGTFKNKFVMLRYKDDIFIDEKDVKKNTKIY